MPIEKITLPDFVVADIYKNLLIEPLETPTFETSFEAQNLEKNQTKKQSEKTTIKFLGENKKKICVLVNEQNSTFVNDEELSFFTRILNACNLNLADIALVNVHQSNIDFATLETEFSSEFVLLFGVSPATIKLPFNVPHFQVQTFSDCTIICCPPLSTFLNDTEESFAQKRLLWAALQKAFKLK